MTETMKPSNDLEVALFAAVDRGDLEAYLHMLRNATVVVPASESELSAGPDSWPLLSLNGQPHIPVFTSPEALVAGSEWRTAEQTSLEMPELAKRWPDPNWRLAVNPGLSTAAYVPGTYALSTGMRLGAIDPVEALQIPDIQLDGFQDIRTGTFATQNQTEQDLLKAMTTGDSELALRSLLGSTLFLISTEKDGYTLPGQAGFRWLTLGSQDGDAVPVFTSRDRVDETMTGGNTYTKLPISLAALADAWPDDDLSLVVNPRCPLTMRLPGPGVLGLTALAEKLGLGPDSSDFKPGAAPDDTKLDTAALGLSLYYSAGSTIDSQDGAEHALLDAASKGDRASFLKILFGLDSGLRLTLDREADPGKRYGGKELPWQTTVIGDQTVLQVFTSPQIQRQVVGYSGRSSAELANLLRYWPDDDWNLAVNAGTPIGGILSADQIASLSEWFDQTIAHQLAHNFPAPPHTDRIDLQLLDAGRRGDRRGFLEMLRPFKIWVSTDNRELDWKVAPTDPTYPWEPVRLRGRSSMVVYTGSYWQKHAGGSGRNVRTALGDLAAAWPEDGPDLVLNPASPISVTLTAEEVRAFAAAGS